jgi:Protein of unknown function (DUF1822)
MLTISELVNIDSRHLWLQIEPSIQVGAWQQAQHHSNPISRYNGYLNRICLYHFCNWLQGWLKEEQSSLDVSVVPSQASLPSIWELVNGTAVQVGQTRLVLVPVETIHLEELRVPQEWVDISDWVADYYVAVQLNLDSDKDEAWMGVYGFATHHQLRTQATYNKGDRTFSLAVEHLNENLTTLLATLGLGFDYKVAPQVNLSSVEVQQLLQTWGNASIYSPRLLLDVPFEKWGALISNEEWRQQLYNLRMGEQKNVVSANLNSSPTPSESTRQKSTLENTRVNLSEWFVKVFEAGWKSLDRFSGTNDGTTELGNFAFGTRSISSTRKADIEGVKLIDFGMQLGGKPIALLLALSQEVEGKVSVLVQVHPTDNEKCLPPNLKLVLLESGGKPLQEIQSRSRDCYIQLNRFKGIPGTKFSIKLILGDCNIVEDFSI